jgi:hypothetical protein
LIKSLSGENRIANTQYLFIGPVFPRGGGSSEQATSADGDLAEVEPIRHSGLAWLLAEKTGLLWWRRGKIKSNNIIIIGSRAVLVPSLVCKMLCCMLHQLRLFVA